jgi:hypothetical protein
MRTQRVLLGQLVIDRELPIDLFAEVPSSEASEAVASLKDRLAFLLDARFHPSDPLPPPRLGPTVEDVAEMLQCRCRTVLRMVRQGQHHPSADEDGELYFDRAEVARIVHVPLSPKLSRLVPPKR